MAPGTTRRPPAPSIPGDANGPRSAPRAKPSHSEQIRQMIVTGALLPNERLVEADLAARLGTNRANIRIALGRLDQEGLVVCEPNHGARVRVVDREEAVQIFEARGALERLVVEHAAQRMTPSGCKRLRTLLHAMREALDRSDIPAFSAATGELRAAIWAASRHGTVSRLLKALNYQLVRFRYQSITMPGRASQSLEHLTAVVDAICAGSPGAAQTAMDTYTAGAVVSLRRSFRRH